MTERPDPTPNPTEVSRPDPSRVEAAEAGAHHEAAEEHAGVAPREHVTATDALTMAHPHHHPDDPNVGVVTSGGTRGATLAAAVAVALVLAAVIALAVAIGGA